MNPQFLKRLSTLLIPIYLATALPVDAFAAVGAPWMAPSDQNISVNRTLPDVLPPSSEISLSDSPTDEEIARVRVFTEPLIPLGTTTDSDNRDLARALTLFMERTKGDDVSSLTQFLEAHPDSPWRLSLLTNLGTIYRGTGWWSKALETWEGAYQLTKDQEVVASTSWWNQESDIRLRSLSDRALAGLLALNSNLGRADRLEEILDELGERNIRGSASEAIQNAREALWKMKNRPEISFRCGPLALGQIASFEDPSQALDDKILSSESTPNGLSLTDVRDLSREIGTNYQMVKRSPGAEFVVPAVVHWKVGHYAALLEKHGEMYFFRDPTFGDKIWISREALDSESSGYFLIPEEGPLLPGWTKVTDEEGETVWGKGIPNAASSDPDATDSDAPTDGGDGNGPGGCGGMPRYRFHSLVVSLNIRDIPLSYQPPIGPKVAFKITYNQREMTQPQVFTYGNLGPQWTFDWFSYIEDNPYTPLAPVFHKKSGGGGRALSWVQQGGSVSQPDTRTMSFLTRTLASTPSSPPHYVRNLPDGGQEIFDLPESTAGFPRKVFMTQKIDPQGRALTFQYDSQFRMVSVTDAIGQVTTLSYEDPNDPLKLTKVTDPFSRFTTLSYNAYGQLISVTDTIGMSSSFTYGYGDFISSMTTPYGTTTFVAGGTAGINRTLTATDPNGASESLEYVDEKLGLPLTETYPVGIATYGSVHLDERQSYYWDKKAMMEAPGDYTKATIHRWLLDPSLTQATSFQEAEKPALESRIWYNYPGQPASYSSAGMTVGSPSKVGRVLDDGSTQLTQYSYNTQGRMTQEIDPLGRTTDYVYDPNGVDLLQVRQTTNGINEVLASYTYNAQHRPLTATDASGQVTTYTYNTDGQVLTVTNPKSEITTYAYDPNGYLQSVTEPLGKTTAYAYDGYGRVVTVTDSEGYTVGLAYDAMDRPVQVIFPDGTSEQVTYDKLNVSQVTDRMGRNTQYFYDAMKRLTGIKDAAGRVTGFEWCDCGAMEALIDPMGRRTEWHHDVQSRVTEKEYPDGKKTLYTYENTTSRLKEVTDAKEQKKQYQYGLDSNLKQIDYANAQVATPSVSFAYDTNYDRLTSMTDGTGVTNYGYHPIVTPPALGAGRLATVDGPLANDVIAYSYDELGRVFGRSIDSVAASVAYDALGRVTNVTNALGSFAHSYVNATSRLSQVLYPNGQKVQYDYYDNLGDQRLKEIKNLDPAQNIVSKFNYTYNPQGQITQWTQQTDNQTPQVWNIGYDPVDQLKSVEVTDQATQAILKEYAYNYDPAGNRTSEQVGSSVTTSTNNNLNQLMSQASGGPLKIKGTVNEPASVTINGHPAKVVGNVAEGTIDAQPGINTFTIAATDASGNTSTQNYQVTLPQGTGKTFTYDDNGNTISETSPTENRTYAWDAEDRLTKITITDPAGTNPVHETDFTYDGLSRRVKIIEKDNGVLISDKRLLWCKSEICEERDSGGGSVTKRYFAEGMSVASGAGNGNYFYNRDHLGSIREMVDVGGVLRARYDYDPYGKRSTNLIVADQVEANFGYTGHYYHYGSGLYLALYRGYDPDIGKWISRDWIERGKESG